MNYTEKIIDAVSETGYVKLVYPKRHVWFIKFKSFLEGVLVGDLISIYGENNSFEIYSKKDYHIKLTELMAKDIKPCSSEEYENALKILNLIKNAEK